MTTDKYHPRNHPLTCAYHVDQYPFECTCGLFANVPNEIITHLTCEIINAADSAQNTTLTTCANASRADGVGQ